MPGPPSTKHAAQRPTDMSRRTTCPLAPVPLLKPRGVRAQVSGDRLAAGGEHAHHRAADALDLEAVAVIARDPFHAEPAGERFFQVLGDDRANRADMLGVAQGIWGPA